MKKPRILLIEDNPITRKLVRVTVEPGGYELIEAENGEEAVVRVKDAKPDLILMDLILPDTDGVALLARLRKSADIEKVPVFAFTGFLSKFEQSRITHVGFTDLIVKPCEPSQLLKTLRTYLPLEHPAARRGRGGTVLYADDDPVQLKLGKLRLEQEGFRVLCASDGRSALEILGRERPDLVLSDVLMPEIDGLRLCLTIRKDPKTRDLPVVLISSSFVETSDFEMAKKVGAAALVIRTPDYRAAMEAVSKALHEGCAPRPTDDFDLPEDELKKRLIAKIDRLSSLNSSLLQRCSIESASLSVLAAINQELSAHGDIRVTLSRVLERCLDAAGLSKGVILERAGREFLVLAQAGSNDSQAVQEIFSKHRTLLDGVIDSGAPVTVSQGSKPSPEWRHFLRDRAVNAVVMVPLRWEGERSGILALCSDNIEVEAEHWVGFAGNLAAQLGQALSLAETFASLEESRETLRLFGENLREVLWMSSPSGDKIHYASPAYESVWGRPLNELLESPMAWTDAIIPEDRAKVEEQFRLALERGQYAIEYRIRKPDGAIRWIRDRCVAVRDAVGKTLRLVGIAEDVTTQKDAEAERESIQAQLVQAQKMESVGRLAGGVAHDFNNLLTAILGLTELSIKNLPADHSVRSDLRDIRETAQRAANLTQQLLAFSRKQIIAPRVVDLSELVVNIDKMLRRIIGEDVTLSLRRASGLWMACVDPHQIEQVILNLCVNARDAMPRGGTISIETSNVTVRADAAAIQGQPTAGDYVLLTIADTGSGMSRETIGHIFEPFFTTKPKEKGTGLGLATCYGIVKQSDGHIFCSSAEGRGTIFNIYLPRTLRRPEAPSNGAPSPAPMGQETILIVEDETTVRKLLARMLRQLGYTVLEAADPEEGLRAVAADAKHELRLVVTDVVMPRGGCSALSEGLRKVRPDVRILYTSGYTDDSIVRQGVLDTGIHFLPKPYELDGLAHKVREVLGSA